jgi:Catalase
VAKRPILTIDSGMPVSDSQNSVTAGPRGPLLMQDFILFEELAHQNRERIPEPGQPARRRWKAWRSRSSRQIIQRYRPDPGYGAGVAKAPGINFTPQMIAAE